MKLKLLILVVLVSGLIAGLVLIRHRQLLQKKATMTGATLALTASINPVAVNLPFTVDVFLNPNQIALAAVDLLLTFPLDKLSLQNIQIKNTYFKTFVPVLANNTGVFDANKVLTLARQNGVIEFGATAFDWTAQATSTPVTAPHVLATLTFLPLAPGTNVPLAFAFNPNSANTTDSNAVRADTGADVLAQANALTLTINPAGLPTEPPPTGGPTATLTPTSTPTSTPTVTPTPTLTPTPAPASLTVNFKFQGISDNRAVGKTVRLLNEDLLAEHAASDPEGVYRITKNNLTAGEYSVYLKGWAHLQKNCGSATLVAGQTTVVDCTATPLKAGDFVGNNNVLNIDDISALISKYTALNVPVDDYNRPFDIDANNVINITDISLIISNYTALNVSGD